MSDSEEGAPSGAAPEARPQMPIGGMVRDPREVKTNPTLTRFLRERMTSGIIGSLVAIGVLRPKLPSGELGRRSWRGLFTFLLSVFAIVFVWTSVHIVQPGTVGVPVTFGHPGKPLSPGLHITLPFTSAYSMSTRTQNYTMTSLKGEGQKQNTDDSVAVLGKDGGAAQVNATVLYRVDPSRATTVFRNLGTNYATAIVRPSARSCIRLVFTQETVVAAATTDWGSVESNVGSCMVRKLSPEGLTLQDFQLREVTLSVSVQKAVDAKVAAEQLEEQQQFDAATAQQLADIKRTQALAIADSQQIIECGGHALPGTLLHPGKTIIPNPLGQCSKSGLDTAFLQFTYIQALQQLAASPGTTTLVLPFDKNLTPLITLPGATPGK
jgi:regulator of protease activity HflC (stomatin/prohibitin superfamily)